MRVGGVVAAAALRESDRQIQRYRLLESAGEPQLQARVLRLLLKTHEQTGSKAGRERRDEIFQRLCHLDFDVVLEQALGP